MIGPGGGVDVASVPRFVQKDGGKIGVGKMTVTSEKKAAPETVKTAEQVRAEAKAIADQLKTDSLQLAAQARGVMGGSTERAWMALKILSGGDATMGALMGKMEVEMGAASKTQDPAERQRKMTEIQNRYRKLSDYAEKRQTDTRKDMDKLKQSKTPEDQVLVLDIEIARNQINIRGYEESIKTIELTLERGISPITGGPLDRQERTKYESMMENYSEQIKGLRKKNGEIGKDGLTNQRENLRNERGEKIPPLLENLALALTDGSVDAVKLAKENPLSFLEVMVGKALTNTEGMTSLADNLVNAKILDEKNKEKFIKDMELGLTTEHRLEMIKETGGKTIMSLISLMGLLGYTAWQRTKEGAGQGMMG